MRGVVGTAAVLVALAGMALAQPGPCPGTATITVFVDNRTGTPVDVDVEGELAPDAVTCVGSGAPSYPVAHLSCGPVAGVCGTIEGRLPGAWVHRMTATAPGSAAEQQQAQRTVLVAGDPVGSNVVVWTVYPRTFVVSTTASDSSPGSLRAALSAAGAYTSTPLTEPALVIFSRELFQGADVKIDLSGGACDPNSPISPEAALCFRHSKVVVDGLDRNANTGRVVWSVGTESDSVLRVYGSENVFRGIVFQGSAAEVLDPANCGEPGEPPQADTVAITEGAHDNQLEQCLVLGPTCGDGVGVDEGAYDNVIVESRITGAQDKGLKANNGSVTIRNSCVHGNDNGGIQSTLGGNVHADENVVQNNAGGQGQNGLTVIDQCKEGNLNPDCKHEWRSILTTKGNVVRFSGGKGLAVTDNAEGTFDSDYVANNCVKGAEVDNNGHVPFLNEIQRVPWARFHGVGFVCNYSGGNEGVGAETRRELDQNDPPDVGFGDAENPGRNAFTSNRGFIQDTGANFLLSRITSPISAIGNQWGNCADTIADDQCDEDSVRLKDIRPEAPANANVTLVEPGAPFDGSRTGSPMIHHIVPTRPRAGEIVRIYGENFDAINGNPTRGASCDSVSMPACSPDVPCPTGPCVREGIAGNPCVREGIAVKEDGFCPCSIDNQAVHERNAVAEEGPTPPHRIRIGSRDPLSSVLADIPPDAVTPTMLAFHMPFDCFASLWLEVTKYSQVERVLFLCDPTGCRDQPQGTPCDDGQELTAGDHCDGGGGCGGDPIPTSSTTVIAATSTSTSTTAAPTTSTSTSMPPSVTTSTTTDFSSSTTSTTGASTTTTPAATSSTTSSTTVIHTSTSVTTTTKIVTTTTAVDSTTTTTTLLRVCDLTIPSSGDVDACAKPRLHRRARKVLASIERALGMGRQPKCRRVRVLNTLLRHCGALTAKAS